MGSAFHIGDGYCVTARHVIDGNQILSIGRRDTSLKTQITASGPVRTTTFGSLSHKVFEAPLFHPDDRVDVAIVRLGGRIGGGRGYPVSQLQPCVPLDRQVDLLTEGEYLLRPVVILGYPPIPWASDAHLVVFRGEVSAVIENRNDRQRHFVISGMARGGFSGGPVMSTQGAVGIVTDSLGEDGMPTELGFISATSVRAVREIVQHHALRLKP